MDTQIRAELTEFIVTNYLFGDIARVPQDDDSLVEKGIIDSTGILELIEFLESRFGVQEAYAKVSLKKYKPMAARNEDRNVSSGLL